MLGGLLHADLLSRKHLTEIDLAPLVADTAAAGHDGGPVVKRIVELLQSPIEPRGCRSPRQNLPSDRNGAMVVADYRVELHGRTTYAWLAMKKVRT